LDGSLEASSFRANLEFLGGSRLKPALGVRDNDERGVDDIMQEMDQLFNQPSFSAKVQS
jgi:hypothetical protein